MANLEVDKATSTDKQEQGNTLSKRNATIAVIGKGPAGMLSALALAQKGFASFLIGPMPNNNDQRTTALMMPAIHFLEKLSVWQDLHQKAAPLSTMRIIDGTHRLIRSPVVNFRASEINEKAFGYNMPNTALNKAIAKKIKETSLITELSTSVKSYNYKNDYVEILCEDGTIINAGLVVGADGRNSSARNFAKITSRQWKYPQTAVILSFAHEFPHNNISTEFHTEDGPFTQVPLPGNFSSLVWVANPKYANELLSMGKEGLEKAIEKRMQSMLGKVQVTTPAQGFELGGVVPKTFAQNRTILVGEAAHVFPPIGAQGLNLGIRDAINLVKSVEKSPNDPGAISVLSGYNQMRKPDIWVRTGSVHALNRALLSNWLPAQIMRNVGLETLRNFSPLRNFFMREGMKPGNGIEATKKILVAPFKKHIS